MSTEEEKGLEVNVVVARPNVNPVIEGQTIVLELLEGWDNLEDRQKKYLELYAKDPNVPKIMIAMSLGYKTSEVNKWLQQEQFSLVSSQIFDIYTDLLKGIDYHDSIKNSKIRARVIQARENKNKYTKESKGTQHNHLHVGKDYNLADLLKGK